MKTFACWCRRGGSSLVAGVALLLAAAVPVATRMAAFVESRAVAARVSDLAERPLVAAQIASCGAAALSQIVVERNDQLLASWQTVGGCGAGASSGTGAGLKWIGRSTTGGLFQVQCQGNYVALDDGYLYSANTLINRDLGQKWNLGVNVPWLYKYWREPYGPGLDISNEGWGDVAVLLTRRLGPINATTVTASIGIPTGGHAAADARGSVLRQDKQMGHGKLTAGLIVDHTFDNLWGPVVIGGTVDYRGGENERGAYRSPAGSLYSYAGYLLGPFTPAFGLTFNHFRSEDRDNGFPQPRPGSTVAVNASLEFATEYIAFLLGGSQPFDLKGARQPWLVGLGASISPF